jgi:serine/threonine protein kinase
MDYCILIGSFGAVYLAEDKESGIFVAVKVFFEGDEKVPIFFIFILFYYHYNNKLFYKY